MSYSQPADTERHPTQWTGYKLNGIANTLGRENIRKWHNFHQIRSETLLWHLPFSAKMPEHLKILLL